MDVGGARFPGSQALWYWIRAGESLLISEMDRIAGYFEIDGLRLREDRYRRIFALCGGSRTDGACLLRRTE